MNHEQILKTIELTRNPILNLSPLDHAKTIRVSAEAARNIPPAPWLNQPGVEDVAIALCLQPVFDAFVAESTLLARAAANLFNVIYALHAREVKFMHLYADSKEVDAKMAMDSAVAIISAMEEAMDPFIVYALDDGTHCAAIDMKFEFPEQK